jgi:hypothetical protein
MLFAMVGDGQQTAGGGPPAWEYTGQPQHEVQVLCVLDTRHELVQGQAGHNPNLLRDAVVQGKLQQVVEGVMCV